MSRSTHPLTGYDQRHGGRMPARLLKGTAKLRALLGQRGGYLLTMGFFYVVVGIPSALTAAPPDTAQWWLEQWTFPFIGWLWVLAGVVAMVGAFTGRARQDAFSFAALALVPLIWATGALAVAGMHWDPPHGGFTLAIAAIPVVIVVIVLVEIKMEPPRFVMGIFLLATFVLAVLWVVLLTQAVNADAPRNLYLAAILLALVAPTWWNAGVEEPPRRRGRRQRLSL